VSKNFSYLLVFPFVVFSVVFATGLGVDYLDKANVSLVEMRLTEDEFVLEGPDELCLYYGSIIGDFFGGGRASDVFRWRVFDESGNLIIQREGSFQTFSHTFSTVGNYTIELSVRRGTTQVFSESKEIEINPGVDLVIQPSYPICNGESTVLTLIDPNSPDIDDFFIEWKDQSGQVIGNSNSITVDQVGFYSVDFHTTNEVGEVICPFTVGVEVKPPQDFSITSSIASACPRWVPINLSAGNNITGEWFFLKEGESERVSIGIGGQITTNALELNGPGEYEFIFVVNDIENKYCKSEEIIPFEVLPVGEVSIEIVDSESCGIYNGEINITTITSIDQLVIFKDGEWFQPLGEVPSGEELNVDNLEAGTYSLRIRKGTCESWIPFTIDLVDIPPDLDVLDVERIRESCSETGVMDGSLRILLGAPFTGTLEVFSSIGLKLPDDSGVFQIDNQQEIEIPLPSNNYFFQLQNDQGCQHSYPDILWIPPANRVNFTTQNILNVCQTFDFIPNTNEELLFTLTYPDGSSDSRTYEESFVLDQEGEYTILGAPLDPNSELCPRERTFFVNIIEPIPYEPVLVDEDCFGNKTYEAELFGVNPSLVRIRWYNENDQVVGTGRFLFPTTFGEFKLDVQPLNSEACPNPPTVFEVSRPVLELDIDYTATTFCSSNGQAAITINAEFEEVDHIEWLIYDENGQGIILPEFENQTDLLVSQIGTYEVVLYRSINGDLICEIGRRLIEIVETEVLDDFTLIAGLLCEDPGFTILSISADESEIDRILWYFTDNNGVRVALPEFENEISIPVETEGLYGVEAFNSFDCVIAEDEVLVLRSMDDTRPELEDEYVVCPFLEVGETIDGGDFEAYQWFLNGELVNSDRFFEPIVAGEYTLEVTNLDGCQISQTFNVIENCDVQVVYPNAIQPFNNNKNFVIYSNYLVDELNVWIYNKWGQLLHHCHDREIFDGKASCVWDGTFNGERLPPGSYALKIEYKNRNEPDSKSLIDSIFIID
jgi:PKD repeat protein